jgi:Zn-dependent peptidase ImmA (M78 family)/transcriptional regulator with XRE-family HTH domain
MSGQSPAIAAQPGILVLARESRGMTQADVARAFSEGPGTAEPASQGYVSKAEAGRIRVSGERLSDYAAALGYPPELLAMDEVPLGAGVGLVHHRRRASLAAGDLRRTHAVLNLTRIQVQSLLRASGRELPHKFPEIKVDDFDTPEDAAREVRESWGIGPGPVPCLVCAIEDAGGLVVRRSLAGRELDAVSQRLECGNPLFLLNYGTPADRERYTLAHEVGHVVMHFMPSDEQERQADLFAGEFLMPARDILTSLKGGLNLSRLIDLKARWRVSMAAIARRAHTLGAISDWQYRQLNVELSTLGYRTAEPTTIAPEQPAAVGQLVRDLGSSQELRVTDLARITGLLEHEFTDLYLSDRALRTDAHALAASSPAVAAQSGCSQYARQDQYQ